MNFLLKKEITASLFNRGFAVPVAAMPVLSAYLGGRTLAHGERRAVKIILDGETFDATLTSVNFDRNKFPDHSDIWQIIYSEKSPIAQKFAEIFARSRAANFKLPETEREYFVLYATDTPDIFCVEPIFNAEISDAVESPSAHAEATPMNTFNIKKLTIDELEKFSKAELEKLIEENCDEADIENWNMENELIRAFYNCIIKNAPPVDLNALTADDIKKMSDDEIYALMVLKYGLALSNLDYRDELLREWANRIAIGYN